MVWYACNLYKLLRLQAARTRPWKAAWGRLEEGVADEFFRCFWRFCSLYVFIFLNLMSWNCREPFFSQLLSTPINTEISACCTICRNWEISARFKLTWRIRAWQQRRRWNCYRRWWTWSGLQNIYGTLLNESYFLCREPFLLWNDGNWCDWNGWNLFFGWVFWFLEAEKNKLEGQMSQFRQEVGRCHWNVLHMVATLCKCFVCCTCYRMPCEWHVFVMLSSRM